MGPPRVRYRKTLERGYAPQSKTAYNFSMGGDARKYAAAQIDLFAFVALDRKEAFYISAAQVLTGAKQAHKAIGCQRFAAEAPGSLDRFLLDRFFA